jgi:hypothetical protein
MSNLKNIKDGTVPLTKPVLCRCPHCSKPNPIIDAEKIGETTDCVMVSFIPQCCKKLLGCQLLAKGSAVVTNQTQPDVDPTKVV